ncbi:SprT domain-containing protein [Naegleria gruberi]|uniref:SprT domain-containing protein n=1 Tax=Naegleria gruberi TaxID=5762 RepID=D2VSR1_NAEGR|nr:SprT domain-containing protein [Naegleria gruberi]EFC40238.1 SprT domain-containing protein [Naegleria gruberi]|eukprot:XP_002672982.1 SprT domain-containing protein [Naegleria gruberi strain NEG-M]
MNIYQEQEFSYEVTRNRYLNMCNEFGWRSITWHDFFSNPETILPKGLLSESDNTLPEQPIALLKKEEEQELPRRSTVHFQEEQATLPPLLATQEAADHHHHGKSGNEFNERVVIAISDDDDESDEEMANTSPVRRKSRKSFGKRVIEDHSDSEEEYDFEKDKEKDDVYSIERIIKKRVKNKLVEYYVKWEGYPSSENTWVKESDIVGQDIIEEFEEEEKKKNAFELSDSSEEEEEEAISSDEEDFNFDEESDEEYAESSGEDDDDDEDYDEMEAESPQIKKSKTKTKSNPKNKIDTNVIEIDDDDDDFHEKSILTNKKPAKSSKNSKTLTFEKMDAKKFKKVRDDLLQKYYDEFNKVCFQNKLPAMKVTKGKAKDLKGKAYLLWNQHLRKTAGLCKLFTITKSQIKVCAIEMSTKVCDCEERLVHTLAHEMCHAASFMFDGITGHGKTFYLYGGIIQKYYPDIPITTCHSYDIEYKYQWQCTDCGSIVKRHSKSVDTTKQRCGVCTGILEPIGKTKQPTKYNLFMKENYKKLKDKNPHLDRKELMKLVAQSYKESNQ